MSVLTAGGNGSPTLGDSDDSTPFGDRRAMSASARSLATRPATRW